MVIQKLEKKGSVSYVYIKRENPPDPSSNWKPGQQIAIPPDPCIHGTWIDRAALKLEMMSAGGRSIQWQYLESQYFTDDFGAYNI